MGFILASDRVKSFHFKFVQQFKFISHINPPNHLLFSRSSKVLLFPRNISTLFLILPRSKSPPLKTRPYLPLITRLRVLHQETILHAMLIWPVQRDFPQTPRRFKREAVHDDRAAATGPRMGLGMSESQMNQKWMIYFRNKQGSEAGGNHPLVCREEGEEEMQSCSLRSPGYNSLGQQTSHYKGQRFLTSLQLSCQHLTRLRFNEENKHLHRKCSQQLNLSTTFIRTSGEVKGWPASQDQISGLPDLGGGRGEHLHSSGNRLLRVTTSSDYKLREPLTFSLQAQWA